MHRHVLIGCLPYVAAIAASVGVLWMLVRVSRARPRLAHVFALHRDEQGGVQSLSFVLTLPLFVMVLMFIVQLSQLTIAKIVVEYAAFAAARSAVVWIPAETSAERANCIGANRNYVRDMEDDEGRRYAVYQVETSGPKFERVHAAAASALMSICPSREVGAGRNHPSFGALGAIQRAYQTLSPQSVENTRINPRLANKLAYALENTWVAVELHHSQDIVMGGDAPVERHPEFDRIQYPPEFQHNEYGWQDQVYLTVAHDFALLPGPGRLLARRADARPGASPESDPGYDRIAKSIRRPRGVYVRTITATVRLSSEGQKSVLPYFQPNREGGTVTTEPPETYYQQESAYRPAMDEDCCGTP